MRKIKLAFFALLQLCFSMTLAQQPVLRGQLINARDNQPTPITYRIDSNQNDNSTKYNIFQSGHEIYEVDFFYYEDHDSIAIHFYNKDAGTSFKKTVKFTSGFDSHVIIKNYLLNEEPIKDQENHSILFSMDDNFIVTLYQFKAVDDEQSLFILQPTVPSAVIEKHHNKVGTYNRRKDLEEEQRKKIVDIINRLKEYRDKTIQKIETEETYIRNKKSNITATPILQRDFESRLDTVFTRRFKNTSQFESDSFRLFFNFSCNGYGKIKIDSNFVFNYEDGRRRNWFQDSFYRYIKPWIESAIFLNPIDEMNNPELVTDFEKYVRDSIDKLGTDSIMINETQNRIIDELTPLVKKTIYVPVKYSYPFRYSSTSTNVTWKYIVTANGAGEIKDKSDGPGEGFLDQNYDALKQIFIDTVKPQNGKKYNVQISIVSINGRRQGILMKLK